ncbi:hypothetical protein F5H01DRAFT_155209 [Linnemannia elongata]|nr:hypothetical protein F5H01DRAFT_155209 [Linnemannia elongata]
MGGHLLHSGQHKCDRHRSLPHQGCSILLLVSSFSPFTFAHFLPLSPIRFPYSSTSFHTPSPPKATTSNQAQRTNMNNKNKEERQQDQDRQQREAESAPPEYTKEAEYQPPPRKLVAQGYQPYHDTDFPPQYLERQEQVQDQLLVPWADQQQRSTTALPKKIQDALINFSKKQQQRSARAQRQREAAIKMEQQRQEYFERQQQQQAMWAEQQREAAAKMGRERLAYVEKQQEQRAAWAERKREYAVQMEQQRQAYFEKQQEQRAAWAEKQLQAAVAWYAHAQSKVDSASSRVVPQEWKS